MSLSHPPGLTSKVFGFFHLILSLWWHTLYASVLTLFWSEMAGNTHLWERLNSKTQHQMLRKMGSNRNTHSLLWECKVIQLLWKPACRFLTKLNIQCSHKHSLPKIPKGAENLSAQKSSSRYLQLLKPSCPSVGEWINKLRNIQTMKYFQ